MTLLEAYAKRLAVSESVYSKQHSGAKMSNHKKLTVAKVLENTNKFLNEAFSSAMGTQRADMGEFKKFCLNLTTVALPNLIANDLVLVSPMSSMTGYITYIEYSTVDTNLDGKKFRKGGVINNPFKLGDVDANYTSSCVVEELAATGKFTPGFKVAEGAFVDNAGNQRDLRVTAQDGTVTFYNAEDEITVPDGEKVKVAYMYNNITVPMSMDSIPAIKAEMKSMALLAKARRIAVYYSQIAAFQAKTDYGFDLGDQLAEKAVGQLSYEIDTEIVNLLDETAGPEATVEDGVTLKWTRDIPVGVSKAEHYEGFSEVIEVGRQMIYDRTKRFAPNYMVCASDILPILTFMKGFSAAPTGQINGPYFAGTLNGLKVYVSPAINKGRFLLGVNGDDMMSSVAVYAPYMAIVPTQLLQYADGGTSQGWSTMYDLKVLNKDLIVAGQVDGTVFGKHYAGE
jgi:hypothetical protein